ncbi:lytic transglycosylase domain-containing protein [Xanthomonas tesorieronis]|uniref:lytic transglycosylase domain-containing protein n=1 Tax=Xanthomonas tesorieronis TaxID=3160839 RepID=UPI003513EC8A
MLPGFEMLACGDMATPMSVMQHVVHVESSYNPYAIGVVGGRLVRQPQNLAEALSTVQMLEDKGYNFSVGLAQVNRYNLTKYGLQTYEQAFQQCPNLKAGSAILSECYRRSGNDWGKAFSCYYSGNFVTGFRHGYVQKIYNSIARNTAQNGVAPIPLAGANVVRPGKAVTTIAPNRALSRVVGDKSAEIDAPPDPAQVFAAQKQSVAPALTQLSSSENSHSTGAEATNGSVDAKSAGTRNGLGAVGGAAGGEEVAILMGSTQAPVMLGAASAKPVAQPSAPVVTPSQKPAVIRGDAAFVF